MKILIEALHGLGDTVCMLPMISAVRNKYPQAIITVLIKYAVNSTILQSSGINIDNIVVLNLYNKNIYSSIKEITYLRKQKFDLGINSANTPVKKAKLFMSLIKPKKVIGIQHEKQLCFDLLEDRYHFVDANLMALESLVGNTCRGKLPKLYVEKEVLDKMAIKIKPINSKTIIGVCIGNADISYRYKWLRMGKVYTRGWGISKIVELIKNLIKANYGVVLFGGKLEEKLLQYIPFDIQKDPNVINMVNKTNLGESMALAKLCDMVVGVDTGMIHIADALGVKTVSVFGPTNPRTHGAYSEQARFVETECECKYCYGTRMYVECDNRKCLKNINVKGVYHEIAREV